MPSSVKTKSASQKTKEAPVPTTPEFPVSAMTPREREQMGIADPPSQPPTLEAAKPKNGVDPEQVAQLIKAARSAAETHGLLDGVTFDTSHIAGGSHVYSPVGGGLGTLNIPPVLLHHGDGVDRHAVEMAASDIAGDGLRDRIVAVAKADPVVHNWIEALDTFERVQSQLEGIEFTVRQLEERKAQVTKGANASTVVREFGEVARELQAAQEERDLVKDTLAQLRTEKATNERMAKDRISGSVRAERGLWTRRFEAALNSAIEQMFLGKTPAIVAVVLARALGIGPGVQQNEGAAMRQLRAEITGRPAE